MIENKNKPHGTLVILSDEMQEWYENGQRHRLDGPAVIYADGTQEWWVGGQRHRLDGPAVIYANGITHWYIHDVDMSDQISAWMQELAVSWPWDSAVQTQFQLTWE
jgi:hypothetical protein